ncbi:GRB2-associated-binding protein 2-like [Cricetulus griseus]|uniref:GRB2-associated-binding protein 2-like n=1 Tax=Cricetulus griseus TaxID=10029 RepID=UPI0015C40D55|nr:GRB2-associated-binding protein 2-like [Cricetulus griseus]
MGNPPLRNPSHSFCQICGFSQTKESTDALRNLFSVSHSLCSSPVEFSSSSQHLLRARKSSSPSHSSQPPVSSHIQPDLSTSEPQEYLYLHQCISRRTENARSASFSQGTRQKSDTAVQKLAQGNGHCINGVSGQVHGFYSLPKPSRHNTEFKDSTYDLPRSLASHSHTKSSLTGSEADSEDVYSFKAQTPQWGSPQQRPPVSAYNTQHEAEKPPAGLLNPPKGLSWVIQTVPALMTTMCP